MDEDTYGIWTEITLEKQKYIRWRNLLCVNKSAPDSKPESHKLSTW